MAAHARAHAHTPALTGERARSRAMTRVDTRKETTSYRVPCVFSIIRRVEILHPAPPSHTKLWQDGCFSEVRPDLSIFISIFKFQFFFVHFFFLYVGFLHFCHTRTFCCLSLYFMLNYDISVIFWHFWHFRFFWPLKKISISRNCEILLSNCDNNHFCELQPYFISFFSHG